MRLIANALVTTSLVVVAALAAAPVRAADVDASSAVDAVTVYPDGASVTRVITLDLPAGDNSAGPEGFSADAGSVLAAGRRRGGRKAHHRRDRRQAAARGAAGQSARTRQAHRGAEGPARRSAGRDQCRRGAAQIRRALCGSFARRDRRQGRGAPDRRMAHRLCRGRRGSREPPIPRSATPSASSANSTARSRGWNPTGRRSRRASSRSGSKSPPPPRPRRRCG